MLVSIPACSAHLGTALWGRTADVRLSRVIGFSYNCSCQSAALSQSHLEIQIKKKSVCFGCKMLKVHLGEKHMLSIGKAIRPQVFSSAMGVRRLASMSRNAVLSFCPVKANSKQNTFHFSVSITLKKKKNFIQIYFESVVVYS